MHTDLEHEQALARLLRDLPDPAAQPYGWQEFRRRAAAAPAAAARVVRLRVLAVAIVVALAIGAAVVRLGGGARPPGPPPTPATAARETPTQPAGGEPAERSQAEAELWLASLPREPGVVRVGTRAAVETLEDHIAEVDDLLSSARAGRTPAARLRALRQERAQLVSSLVQVRYAETLADASR